MKNRQVLLASYPRGPIKPSNFQVTETELRPVRDGEFLLRNQYFSLDAGFRQWMQEGASDNYLAAMPLGEPAMSITLGEVVESKAPSFPKGTQILARSSWQDYVITNGSDITIPIDNPANMPLYYFAGVLGPTGITAHLGMLNVGEVKAGEDVLVSAAASAVGTVAGQIAKLKGARVVGTASTQEKCSWLVDAVGLDAAINYKTSAPLDRLVKDAFPDGIDVYFDNVGGELLSAAAGNLKEFARIALCGSVSSYDTDQTAPGIRNIWELVTKRAMMRGFMFSDYVEDAPAILAEITGWLQEGKLASFDHITDGLENTPQAFCDMLAGMNFGKSIVRLF